MTCGASLLDTDTTINMAINGSGRQITLCTTFEAVHEDPCYAEMIQIPSGSTSIPHEKFLKFQFGFWILD